MIAKNHMLISDNRLGFLNRVTMIRERKKKVIQQLHAQAHHNITMRNLYNLWETPLIGPSIFFKHSILDFCAVSHRY